MKKILFVASVQEHIIAFHIPFIKYFQDRGYEVHVASNIDRDIDISNDNILKSIIWKNINFTRNPISKNNIYSFKQLIEYMKKNQFSLVHTHTPAASFISRYAAKYTKTKIIYTAHGFHFYKGAPIKNYIVYGLAEKIAAKWCNGIITMNEEDYKFAQKHLKSNKVKVYKVNGVGLDIKNYKVDDIIDLEFKKSLGLDDDDFVITIVAELIKRKNHIQAIDAMRKICKKHNDIKLLIVGDGELKEETKTYIEVNGLYNNIKLLGQRNDVPKILNITDVLALFSYQEGLPRNIMEAMAAKRPIICTDIRGNVDLEF